MKTKLIIVTAGMILATACTPGQSRSNNQSNQACSASCAEETVFRLIQQDKELAAQLKDRSLSREADETLRAVQAHPDKAGILYAQYIWKITNGLSRAALVVEMIGLPHTDACGKLRDSILDYGKKYGEKKNTLSTAELNQITKQFYNDRSRQQGQCFKLVK